MAFWNVILKDRVAFLRGTCVKNYAETISRSEYLQIAVRQELKSVQTLISQRRLKKKVGFLGA